MKTLKNKKFFNDLENLKRFSKKIIKISLILIFILILETLLVISIGLTPKNYLIVGSDDNIWGYKLERRYNNSYDTFLISHTENGSLKKGLNTSFYDINITNQFLYMGTELNLWIMTRFVNVSWDNVTYDNELDDKLDEPTIIRNVNDTWVFNIINNNTFQNKLINSSNITCIGNYCYYNGTDKDTIFNPSILDYVNHTQLDNDTILRNHLTNITYNNELTYTSLDGLDIVNTSMLDNDTILRNHLTNITYDSELTYTSFDGLDIVNTSMLDNKTILRNDTNIYVNKIITSNISSPYANKSYIFFLPDGSVGITLDPIEPPKSPPIKEEKIIRTPSTETVCENGKCYLVLYSGVRFVEEDNQWKELWEAKSFKNSGIKCIVENDGVHLAICEDFNYTHRKIKTSINTLSAIDKTNIPISVYYEEYNETNDLNIIEKSKEYYNFELTPNRDEWIKASYGDIIKIGDKSTTIKLQEPNTENLDDSYTSQGSPNTNDGSNFLFLILDSSTSDYYTMIKFNISAIPSEQGIDESELFIYNFNNRLDSDTEGFNVSVHHIYSFPAYNISDAEWCEGNGGTAAGCEVSWNNAPNSSSQYNTTGEDSYKVWGGSGEPLGWHDWNVTNMVSKSYGDGDLNISIYLIAHDYFGSISATDYIQLYSKEEATQTTLRPFLNITYHLLPAVRVTTTLITPSSGSVDEDGSVTFNCSATAESSSLTNITLYHNITGTWGVNKTQTVGGTSAYANFTYEVANQTNLIWNCLSSNNVGNTSFAVSNWTLTIDIAPLKNPEFFIQNLTGDKLWYVNSLGNMWLSNDLDVDGNIIPLLNDTYDLGSNQLRWSRVWVDEVHSSSGTIYVGDVSIKAEGNDIEVSGIHVGADGGDGDFCAHDQGIPPVHDGFQLYARNNTGKWIWWTQTPEALNRQVALWNTSIEFKNITADYVGIGTTNPNFPLDVAGSIGFHANLVDADAPNADVKIGGTISSRYLRITTGFNGATLRGFGSANDNLELWAGDKEAIVIQEITGNVGIGDNTPETRLDVNGGNVSFDDDKFFYNYNTGNIGIGTISPESLLHINSATVISNILLTLESDINNANEYNEILFKVVGGANYGAIRSHLGSVSDSYMTFSTTTNGGSLVQHMTIQHDGKIGFGTKNPEQDLEIYSSSPQLRIRDSGSTISSSTGFIEFGGTDDGSWNRTGYIGDGSAGNLDLYFQAEYGDLLFGDSSGTVIYLQGGNVGIGNISPQHKLSVQGDIYTNSSSYFMGGGRIWGNGTCLFLSSPDGSTTTEVCNS